LEWRWSDSAVGPPSNRIRPIRLFLLPRDPAIDVTSDTDARPDARPANVWLKFQLNFTASWADTRGDHLLDRSIAVNNYSFGDGL